MAPYRRRDLIIVAICIVALFLWVHYISFDTGTDDEFAHPPFPIEHSIFGSFGKTGSEVRKSKLIQKPITTGENGGKQESMVGDKHSVQELGTRPNSTLGFGGIIAVSTLTSSRRENLRFAGELTGLQITIPDQPKWTDEDVNNFKAKNGSTILRGSVLAWLGHLNALKWFIEQPYDTALIIEDDIDWDIHLRSHQIPLLSQAFHEFLAKQQTSSDESSSESKAYTPSPDSYWPSTDNWELLYMGHCGDYSRASAIKAVPHTIFRDPNMPSHYGLHTDTQRFMKTLSQAGFDYPKTRLLHKSLKPLCSFAYAISKATARRMIKDMSSEAENSGTIAYDVRILEACRDWNWKCWTVNPELFHHIDGEASEIRTVDGGKPSVSNLAGWDVTKYNRPSDEEIARGRARGTPNISCGIRTLVKKLGVGELVRKVVRMSMEVDGLCPISQDEVDGMREHIFMNGRDEIEIGE